MSRSCFVQGVDPRPGETAIYVLLDEEGSPFYVGVTQQLLSQRWHGHRSAPHSETLASRTRAGAFTLSVVAYVPTERALFYESATVRACLESGVPLLNAAPLPLYGDPTSNPAAGVATDVKTCSFSGCSRPARALGLCFTHWQQHRRGKPLTPARKRHVRRMGIGCGVQGCGKPYYASGWCRNHHAKALRGTDPSTHYGGAQGRRR